jgi:hypothetical protein
MAKLVQLTPILLVYIGLLLVFLTIVNGVYRPTYSWGTPPCMEGGMLLNLAHGPAFSDMIQHGHGWHVSYTHIPNLPIISRARVSRLDFNLFKNTYRFNQ